MKILLLKPGIYENTTKNLMLDPSTLPPLGLLYLGAVLENEGHSVEILDFCMENISKERLKTILLKTDAVGMTICSDIDFIPYNKISKMINDIDSDIPQIIGGPHCTFVQKQSLQDIPLANISVIGEGEHVILDLVKYFQGKKALADINGIYYINIIIL